MSITLNGVVHGKRIDLEAEPQIPDGARVMVRIETRKLTADEKRRIIAATSGAWAGDPSIEPIFAELEKRRRETVPRASGL